MTNRPAKSISRFFDRIVGESKNHTQIIVAKDDSLSKPEDWMSTAEMEDIFVGDGMKHTRILKKFIDRKTDELISNGKTPEEATITVNKEWVRKCKVPVNRMMLCASPKAIAELEKGGFIERRDKLLPKPELWLSSGSDEYVGGPEKRKKIFLDFAEEQKQELISNSKTPGEADKIVYKKWIGEFRNGSKTAVCASPQAVQIMEERGLLKKKEKSFVESVGTNGISPGSTHIKERSGMPKER